MLSQQNNSSESYLLPSTAPKSNIRKHIYQPKRYSQPIANLIQNRTQTSMQDYQYQLKSKLLFEQKNQKLNAQQRNKISMTSRNLRLKAIEEYFKSKQTLIPNKLALNSQIMKSHSGAFVGSMKKNDRNKNKSPPRPNNRVSKSQSLKKLQKQGIREKYPLSKDRQMLSQINLVVSKAQKQQFLQKITNANRQHFSYGDRIISQCNQNNEQEQQITDKIISDINFFKASPTNAFQVYLLKLKREEEKEKSRNYKKWNNFPDEISWVTDMGFSK